MKHLSRPFQVAICVFIFFVAAGCSNKVDPVTSLEITVLDRATNKPVSAVSVTLYPSHQDWIDSTNPSTTAKTTDSNGIVSFTDGSDKIEGGKVYYIDAVKGLLDNYASKKADLEITAMGGESKQIKILVW